MTDKEMAQTLRVMASLGWRRDHVTAAVAGAAALELKAELVEALQMARRAMTNDWHNKPRIGMEDECATIDALLKKAEATP